MPKYVIEREFPDAGKMTQQDWAAITQRSCKIMQYRAADPAGRELRHRRQSLLHLHRANEAAIKRHANEGGFPANRISEIRTVIDPTTAEA